MKKKLLLILFVFISLVEIHAQTDTEFWFAPTYVNPQNGNGPVFLRLANSSNQSTLVRIYLPANVAGLDTSFTLLGNGNTSINLTSRLNILTDIIPDKVKKNGIKIESQQPVTVYYEVEGRSNSNLANGMNNCEIFVLKGKNALGTTFFIPNQNFWFTDNNPDSLAAAADIPPRADAGWYKGQAKATIEVLAIEDNTEIIITPKNPYRLQNGTVQNSLAPFTKNLMKGEVYTIEAAFWQPDKHLGGTKVTANKPIAITDKDDTVKEGAAADVFDYGYDLIGDQLVPANVVGAEYLVIQGYLTNTPTGINDYVFMVPTANGTYINIDGVNLPLGPFNAGQVVRHQISKPAVRIFSSSSATATTPDAKNSIYVYQVTGVENELASAILPSTNCSGSSTVTFTRSDKPADALNFYVNLIVKDGGENSFLIDGQPAGNLGFSAPVGGWRYARVSNNTLFPVGTHTVSNTNSLFHLAIFFGGSKKGASYGYFSDFGNIKLNLGLDPFNCANKKATYPLPNLNPVWTSNTFSGSRTTNPFIADTTGTYFVSVTDKYGCSSKDTVNVTYAPDVKVDWKDKDKPICKESEDAARTVLSVNKEYNKYEWTFPPPDNRIITGTTKEFKQITPTVEGKYTLTVTNFYNDGKLPCPATDATPITIRTNFFRFKGLSDTMEYCFGKSLVIDLDTMRTRTNPTYELRWFKNDLPIVYTPVVPWKTSELKETAEYKAILVDQDKCLVKDSVQAIFYPEMPLGWNKNDAVCKESLINKKKTINLNTGYDTYTWTRPNKVQVNSGASYMPLEGGFHKVLVTKIFNTKNKFTCSVKDSSNVNLIDKYFKFKDLGDSLTFCNLGTNSFLLSLDTAKNAPYNGKNIVWYKNDLNQNILDWFQNINFGGEVKAIITDVNDCIFQDSVFVNYVDKIVVNLGGDTVVACLKDLPIQNSLTLTANPSGNYNYTWTTPSGVVIPKNTFSFEVTVGGKYSLYVEDKTFPKCNGTGSTYAIRPTDSLNAPWDNDRRVKCDYSTLELCGPQKLSSYTWYRNGQILPLETSNCLNKFNDSATYRLEMKKFYTSKIFCKGDAEAKVIQYNKQEVGLNNGPNAFCFPHENTAIIRAKSGFVRYDWTPNVSRDSVFKPKTAGKYSLKAYNKDSCYGEGFTDVIFVPQIKLNISSKPEVACWYSDYKIRPGGGFGKYEWFGTDTQLGLLDSIYKPTKTGKYKVVVTTLQGNCKDSATADVEYINQFNILIGQDEFVCNDDTVDFSIDTSLIKYNSFAWYYNDKTNFVGSKSSYSPPIPIIPKNSLSFQFKVIGRAEIRTCYAYDEKMVTYFKTDSVVTLDTTTCINKFVTFNPGKGFYTYKWKLFETELTDTTNSITVNKAGDYRVDLTSKCGGSTFPFSLKNFPEIELDLGEDRSFCVNEPYFILNLKDSVANLAYKYTWRDLDNKNQIITANLLNSRYDIRTQVFVSLEAMDTNSCIKTDTVAIATNDDCFLIPNLFTPGKNDKINPTFQIRGMYPGEWAVEIYNRWGDRVYMNETYNNEWGGENVSDGVYFYSLRNKKRNKEYKGWVQVVNNN